ncbi:hypothetical protein EZV62_004300 [Acer yangbiense]|uniref:Zinc knuckle CX2CX4HX4C domain-containing protein n=1 Tax=Acer yangbiense TaxID=1000413 RepID=A0A5C7IJQ8_9ROSI|nr:hypothetical protein EZV62_004300 [Acer yangbiense]
MVWSRGPWHFDHCLIVLEKSKGTGDISKLPFCSVDFWVQIHNLPLMCMNRRMAKYLAEQIGLVVELPADSRECWGRFIRVKVRIDITKPLKRCVRLTVDNTEEVITAILLYERLLEFCYACGIIGHGLRDRPDDEARLGALEEETTKYGIAPTPNPSKNQNERNSGSNKISGHNSNESVNPKKLMTELIPVSTTREEYERGNGVGLLPDTVSKTQPLNFPNEEADKFHLTAYNEVTQTGGIHGFEEGRDMEIVKAREINPVATVSQVDVSENQGNSSKPGIRK